MADGNTGISLSESPGDGFKRVFEMARRDRAAATALLEKLELDAQVALVCSTPPTQRSEMLSLLPRPEDVIPLMPETELCFTVKAIGIGDAAWLLDYSTIEQVVACVDLDIWKGTLPDRDALDSWLDALAHGDDDHFLRSVLGLDPEIVVMYLKHRIHCIQKPEDDNDWEDPDGGQTIDGQFYLIPIRKDDDIAAIIVMLKSLFVSDYWTYFRMMLGVIHELDSANEEWALRWRTGRLEDLGFPPWDRAMQIYNFIRPEERAEIAAEVDPLDETAWDLPIWIPRIPTTIDHEYLLFRTLARLDERQRRAALFAFVALANKIAVADRLDLSDTESTPLAIDKAAKFASAGLQHICEKTEREPIDVIANVMVERLFSVGANLDPEASKPGPFF
jgi:hypothetical protein